MDTIVVDHYMAPGNLLNEIKVGEKVYVPVLEASKIDLRRDVDGIREPTESSPGGGPQL